MVSRNRVRALLANRLESRALLGGGRRGAAFDVRVPSEYILFSRAEPVDAGMVVGRRRRRRDVSCIRSITGIATENRKVVPGFHPAGEHFIQQARSCRRWSARFRASEDSEGTGVSLGRIGRLVRRLGGLNRLDRSQRRGLIRMDLHRGKARNRNGCNNQDDRQYDQQFNERESLLTFHSAVPLPAQRPAPDSARADAQGTGMQEQLAVRNERLRARHGGMKDRCDPFLADGGLE